MAASSRVRVVVGSSTRSGFCSEQIAVSVLGECLRPVVGQPGIVCQQHLICAHLEGGLADFLDASSEHRCNSRAERLGQTKGLPGGRLDGALEVIDIHQGLHRTFSAMIFSTSDCAIVAGVSPEITSQLTS